ncbi:alpha/beta hydrolase [Subsaxibacter sp. CAU 1640]|uniref:alpha/beta hydrolase n=1 Tax=Subsaxibacter sp. CAU 1640 TaxID=2933271 RepID=UPI002005C76C|nr:alpha/beta hydrolase [Subsaxibacter sp. CAU 1640]MCK7589083.1 alpha/beta hydrolase [Subsaxibacter sp. CAU 1640]
MIRINSSIWKNIFFCSLLMTSIDIHLYSQEKEPEFKPYTIESTYQKLKKYHPFITPIEPLVSKDILANEDIVYKSIEDTLLKLDIYTPKDTLKSYPAVLLIHGGGWLTGSKENQRVMAQHLALNGFVAVTASYRLGLESPYPAAVHDLKDAIRWMRQNDKKYSIDSKKIAVLGASAGGQLATLIGITPNSEVFGFDADVSDDVQAIVNVDGIVSFIHPEAASEGKMASIWLNGTRDENFENWKEASPLEYVNASSPPILFINSSQPRFHAGRDDMVALLNDFGIYNETFTIEDSPHSFWLVQPWFETTLNYTVKFLNKTLRD